MAHFMTRIPRYVYLGIGVIMGHVIKSARKIYLTVIKHIHVSGLEDQF